MIKENELEREKRELEEKKLPNEPKIEEKVIESVIEDLMVELEKQVPDSTQMDN